jgi:uncharacterized protein
MTPDLAVQSIVWSYRFAKRNLGGDEPLNVTFHGGEPLLAGIDFYEEVFRRWYSLARGEVRFGLQSNLWIFDEAFCDLFARYRVTIGTSLDGSQRISDAARCWGYYDNCLRGIDIAKRRGIRVGAIATVTRAAASHADEILSQFINLDIDFKANAAVPRLGGDPSDAEWILSPEHYSRFLSHLLRLYLCHTDKVRIDNIDRACHALLARRADTCVFSNCLGHYLAIDSQGGIFPCMRFVGHSEFRMGRVQDEPDIEALKRTTAWETIAERNEAVTKECSECAHWDICMGGCPYNWFASGQGTSRRDPYCIAYKDFYSELLDHAIDEMLDSRNIRAIRSPACVPHRGLMQRGPLLDILSQRVHPDGRTAAFRRVVAAFALATNLPLTALAEEMCRLGISQTPSTAEVSLRELLRKLEAPDHVANDVYLHVTDQCSTGCTHCYASAKAASFPTEMTVEDVCTLCMQGAELGYRRIVITGGEPLEHKDIELLLNRLTALQDNLGACFLTLRTSLLGRMNMSLIPLLDAAFGQIVVSVDGDREHHDSKRYSGCYDRTIRNLRKLLSHRRHAEIRIASLVDPSSEGMRQAEKVFALADLLRIPSVVVRTPRPIGRAAYWVDFDHQLFPVVPPEEAIRQGHYPRSSCGRGMNLHIESNGTVFACYADLQNTELFGCWPKDDLREMLQTEHSRRTLRETVDCVPQCRACEWRYLCGGICRAWAHASGEDRVLHASLCRERKKYAQELLACALAKLRIRKELFGGLKDPQRLVGDKGNV